MTKEQSEAIKYFRDKIKNAKPKYTEILIDGQIIKEEIYPIKMRFDQEDAEKMQTVLNMLKENSAEIQQKNTELAEKNAEIEKYKKLLADNLAKNLNDSIKAKEKANTDLEFLNLGWKTELEKKDKMIDLMAEELQKHIFVLYDGDTITSKKGIIQHYERKVEDD